jgi:hypothetical protein
VLKRIFGTADSAGAIHALSGRQAVFGLNFLTASDNV